MKTTTSVPLLAGSIAALFSACALAQAPATTLPGQVEKQFQRPAEPRVQPGEIRLPDPTQPLPAGAADTKLTLKGLALEGSTVYRDADIRPLYEKLVGQQVSLADIYAVADALTAKYRNEGYILSQVIVPAQTVEDGTIRLQAVEGYVATVQAEGELDSRGRELLRRYGAKIQAARPLTAAALERYLLLMNDLPGAFASATLVASPTQQGAADLLVKFSQRPVGAGLTIDNRGGRQLGPWRATADLDLNSVFGLQEHTGLRVAVAPERELDYVSLSHDHQLNAEGLKLGLQWAATHARPEALGNFNPDIATSSRTGALSLAYPLLRSRNENLYLRGAFTGYNGETQVLGQRFSRDRIRAVRLGSTWDKADAARGINLVDVEFSQGIRGLGASNNGDPELSRANGNVDFSKLTLYAARLQSLGGRWSLLAAANAQVAFSDLLSSELFSVGGEQFGRGYDPSEIVGDNGAAAKLELRYAQAVDAGILSAWSAYGFYDAGFVRQRDPQGQRATNSLSSAGIGLRANAGRYLSGYVEFAKPLTRTVAAEDDRALRIYTGLSARF